jgi:hypothetical protein
MTAGSSQPPVACTLDASALGEREQEFRLLFAAALRRVTRSGACAARIVLDRRFEREARDLLAREARCCAFFAFDFAADGDALVVDASVPADAALALDFLLGLAAQS